MDQQQEALFIEVFSGFLKLALDGKQAEMDRAETHRFIQGLL